MADYYWIGDVDSDPTTYQNWVTELGGTTLHTGPPTSSDDCYFTHYGVGDCVWNIAEVNSIQWLSTGEETDLAGQQVADGSIASADLITKPVGRKKRFSHKLTLTGGTLTLNYMKIDGKLWASGAQIIVFQGTAVDSRYIYFDTHAQFHEDISIHINATGAFSLDNGEYPVMIWKAGTYQCSYIAPTTDFLKTDNTLRPNDGIYIKQLQIDNTVTVSPLPSNRKDKSVQLVITTHNFTTTQNTLDFGNATFGIGAQRGSPTVVPMQGSTSYGDGTGLNIKYRGLRIYKQSGENNQGAVILTKDVLSVNELTIDAGTQLYGQPYAEIEITGLPNIKGSMGNFIEISPGRYRASEAKNQLGNQILNWKYGGTGLSTLGSANQVLATNAGGTAIEWQTVSGGGGGGEANEFSFKTISVAGQSDVVADTTTDTLTLVGAGATTITTTAGTDTITITSTDTDTNTQLTDGEIAAMGYIKTDTNTQLSDADIAAMGYIKTDTDTQLSQEQVEDFVDGLLTAGSNITLTYDDSAGTLTIASTDTNTQLSNEEVQDIVGAMFSAGLDIGIISSYDDASGQIQLAVSGGGGASTFLDLTDTPTIFDGSAGKFLKVNSGETALEFTTAPTGEANQNAFTNVAVSGQTTVEADDTEDTLTFVAGSNMTITTNASGDSITFASSGGGGGGGGGFSPIHEVVANGSAVTPRDATYTQVVAECESDGSAPIDVPDMLAGMKVSILNRSDLNPLMVQFPESPVVLAGVPDTAGPIAMLECSAGIGLDLVFMTANASGAPMYYLVGSYNMSDRDVGIRPA